MSTYFFPPIVQQPPVGKGLFIIETPWLDSHTPHSVGLLWTSDQPNAETSTWRHTTFKRRTSVPPEGFEPAIPASVQPQTQALAHATTGAGIRWNLSVLQSKRSLLHYLGGNCSACLDFSLWDNLVGPLGSLAVCPVFRDRKHVGITCYVTWAVTDLEGRCYPKRWPWIGAPVFGMFLNQ